MAQPVVHFEIIEADPQRLRSFYGDLFQWEFDTSGPVAEAVSEAGNYGFVDRYTTDAGSSLKAEVGDAVGPDPERGAEMAGFSGLPRRAARPAARRCT